MLKKLFTAALMLAVSATATATPMKPSIDGMFSISGFAETVLSEENTITSVSFSVAFAGGATGDFLGHIASGNDVEQLVPGDYTNPLTITYNEETELFSTDFALTVGGFTFNAEEVLGNTATPTTGSDTTNLDGNIHIRGTLSHDEFADTYTQLLFSTQGLSTGGSAFTSMSMTILSPAPALISEPGTLAIFGLALVGFAAGRKKKSA